MPDIRFNYFPLLASASHAKSWLTIQANLGLAPNTIVAYGRSLEDFLSFCARSCIEADTASREHIASYIHDLTSRPRQLPKHNGRTSATIGFANATLQQRLTAIRLFYDYLMEEGLREMNPVGRGRYTPGKGFGRKRERGLIPRFHPLPWIPTDDEWRAVLDAAKDEPLRNRMMLALAYDAGLRREELCALAVRDVDPAYRMIHIRAETTKNHLGRTVPYSGPTGQLYTAYLQHRRTLSRERGLLFLSESRRNLAQPLTIWTWSKVVKGIAERAGVTQFTTHTLRHLCLTDLARAGWDIHEIARFAGHRSVQTTLLYIHLSGRDLVAKVEHGMDAIHAWRAKTIAESLQ